MEQSLTSGEWRWPRILSFVSGIGMAAASLMTIQHYFKANFPETIFEGSFCDISAFFNCDSSAFSSISQIGRIPLGYFGLVAGILVALGALFPSEKFERTNTFLAFFNGLGVITLFLYTVFILSTLCLLCSGYYFFSLMSLLLFWRFGIGRGDERFPLRFIRPSLKMLITFGVVAGLGAYGMIALHDAREDAQTGVALNIVKQFYELPVVGNPTFISPFWTARATENFEEAPIHIVEYVDLLCPDCLYLAQQLDRLKEEFAGKINIAIQLFPLEAMCNDVVDKDLHPGACDISLYAMYDPNKFLAIHDEVFANFRAARTPEWRQGLAERYGVTEAVNDPATHELLQKIIQTGAEYERTSDRFAHGIRSTPTMIINGRMIIGTLPYEHMRAIFLALVEEREGGKKFLENWVPPKARK
jgi:protein-disulfide isomerase/uncharacterized membrane protein